MIESVPSVARVACTQPHTHTHTGLSSGNRGSAFVWIRAERLVRPGLCILHCGRPWTSEYRTGIGRREVTQKSRRDEKIGHSPRNKQTFSHNHTNNAYKKKHKTRKTYRPIEARRPRSRISSTHIVRIREKDNQQHDDDEDDDDDDTYVIICLLIVEKPSGVFEIRHKQSHNSRSPMASANSSSCVITRS